MEYQAKPRNHESTGLWLLKIVLGPALVLLLGLHLVVNHLVAPEGLLGWQEVVRYYQNPIIPIIEGLFLTAVIVHSALGMRSIVLDLKPTDKQVKRLDYLLTFLSAVGIVYGVWLVLKIVSFG